MTLHQAKLDIVEAGRRLYDKGYIVSSDGNISARFDEGRLIVTPSGLCKGTISVEDLCVCDMEGRKISGRLSPSSEIGMHLFLYRERPDVKAVVHAHPPTATGFSVAGMPLTDCVLPEVVITLGSIPTADYGTPGGPGISEPIRKYVKDYDAYLLENHGATTVGSDVMNAYFKMETLEHFARILFVARQLGGANVLNQDQVDKLLRIRKRLGIRGPDPACVVGKAPSRPGAANSQIPTLRARSASTPSGDIPPPDDDLVTEITRRVMHELHKENND